MSKMIFTESMSIIKKIINPEDVWKSVESDRERFSEELRNSDVPIYSSSKDHPEFIKQRMPDGTVNIGNFIDGKFMEKKP